ncbi:MAG: N-terminal phage integrase SAM-like domain-containing protein, partial [Acidimicrobiales bacterium]
MAQEPIHQLPSGRWEVRYRDPLGRPRRQRFDRKTDARDHLADVRTKSLNGTWVAPEDGKVTCARWVDEWRRTTVDLRSSTRARYERDLRLHILPRFGQAQLAQIRPRHVRAWLAEMSASAVPVSAIRRRFSVFRKIMGDA